VYVIAVTRVKAFDNAIYDRYTLRNDIADLKNKVKWLVDRIRLTDDRIETARLLKGDSQYKGEAMTCYRCGKELGYRIKCPTDEGVLTICEDSDGCNERILAGRRVENGDAK